MENREQQTIEEIAGKHLYVCYEISDFMDDCYAAMREYAAIETKRETEHLRQENKTLIQRIKELEEQLLRR